MSFSRQRRRSVYYVGHARAVLPAVSEERGAMALAMDETRCGSGGAASGGNAGGEAEALNRATWSSAGGPAAHLQEPRGSIERLQSEARYQQGAGEAAGGTAPCERGLLLVGRQWGVIPDHKCSTPECSHPLGRLRSGSRSTPTRSRNLLDQNGYRYSCRESTPAARSGSVIGRC